MAYTNADTRAKVGFRPYHATDPFGAAHLSGYGSGFGEGLGRPENPFLEENWVLHTREAGLGDYFYNRPFDPWELYSDTHAGLHGLGYLGDGADPTQQAADELLGANQITQAEHDAILEGSMSFQDVLGFDPTDQSTWKSFPGMLSDWNAELSALEQQLAQANLANISAGKDPNVSSAIATLTQQVAAQRQIYNPLASQFIQMYTLMVGTPPAGISGLGIVPVLVWVGGAALLAVGIYFGYQHFKNLNLQTTVQQTLANTASAAQASNASVNAQLVAALQRAQAMGDTITANTISATLAKTNAAPSGAPMSQIESWLTTNAKWIGLGLGTIVVVPALFGRRR